MATTKPTNKSIIDLIKNKSVDAACKYIADIPCHNASEKTLQKDLTRLYQKFKNLNKSKGRVKGKENLERFLNDVYKFPIQSDECEPKPSCSTAPFSSSDDITLQASVYKNVCEELASEVNELRNKQIDLEEELNVVVNEKDVLNESVEELDRKLEVNRKNLKRTANRENYWREKSIKLNENIVTDSDNTACRNDEINELKEEIKSKETQIKQLTLQLHELQSEVDNLKQIENCEFFYETSNTYLPELHNCVYSLLNYQVSCENVCNVINAVCQLLNKKPNKLPTSRTINNWSIERSIIARKQIAEMAENQNTTLHTDEASKYGQKWGAFATRDNEGNYVLLGLRDMATKSSSDTLDTFKEILSDIDMVSKSDDIVSAKLLTNIKNTMSDRAATETKFNELLKNYREEILPQVFDNYNQMSLESQLAISRMNNFFCGLHTLVHMAEVSQKSLCEVEKNFFDNKVPILNPLFTKSGQSGTVRTILTTCKAFARRGDQKNGCYQSFKTYISDFLKENKLLSLPLQPLRGNRFNILFTNAGHVYFLRAKIIEFLNKTSNSNGLLQSVLHDLETPFFISGCKALGLISKYITTPLWRVIENKDVSISMMNQKYLELLNFITSTVNNLEDFITGKLLLFADVPVKSDLILETLLEPSEHDDSVILILSVILPALAKLIQHQYSDHLPGGVHEVVNQNETISVDKHNKFPERVFSLVDHILSAKPNISTLALEAQITFSLNKTDEWLNKQENINEIILESRNEAQKERQRFKERAKIILAKRIEKQEEDFRKKERQEQNRVQKLEKTTTEMLFYGLWQNPSQVEQELSEIKSVKEKEEALKSQLRFRRDVFKQVSARKDVYAFSKSINGKRHQLTVEELKDNVVYLIGNSYNTPPEREHFLVGKHISHKWIENEEPKWFAGRVISQVKLHFNTL